MSLEDLRAQAEEVEEVQEAGQPEDELETEQPEDPEVESEEGGEPESAEESDDFELELEGEPEPDQQKYDPVEVLRHKLSRERKKKRQAREEADEKVKALEEQVKQLTQMLQGGHQPQQPAPQARNAAEPVFPDLYDDGINGDRQKYDAAVKRYFADMQSYQKRHQEAEQAQNQNREQFESMTKQLAERAAKFASENKVKVDVVADALDKATSEIDQATGIDGALAFLLDSVGDGSERVAYYIGTNANAMGKVKALLQQDPKGFKAIAEMTRMVERLKPKHSKRISKAPEPDQSLKGDGSTASAKQLQQMYDKASEKSDMAKMREIKRQAEKVGVALK